MACSNKHFPVPFWYESNQVWYMNYDFTQLEEIYRKSVFDNVDTFLDRSREVWNPEHYNVPNFGTRGEHTGVQTLRMFLCGHKVLKEFLECIYILYKHNE